MSNDTEKKGITSWIDERLPVFTFINHNLRDYPTPKNLVKVGLSTEKPPHRKVTM